jgi:hypothetical protein
MWSVCVTVLFQLVANFLEVHIGRRLTIPEAMIFAQLDESLLGIPKLNLDSELGRSNLPECSHPIAFLGTTKVDIPATASVNVNEIVEVGSRDFRHSGQDFLGRNRRRTHAASDLGANRNIP